VVAEKGALATHLLGIMSFLSRLRGFQMRGSELILIQ
jgi:predicted aspartyl protease